MNDQDDDMFERHATMADRIILVLFIIFSVTITVLWVKELLGWLF